MAKLFFSYSHKDESLRDELEIHLAMLKRQGVIELWHDRRIGAGEDFSKVIDANLDKAEIILLLVSPYFLASDYCYNLEMSRALERNDKAEARVIPVILHPCDWQSAPFGKLRATPSDGKPISKFANMHEAFLEVVNDIKRVAVEMGHSESSNISSYPFSETKQKSSSETGVQDPRTSNLRVKKEFTDQDYDTFLDEAFQFIKRFFENSLLELQQRNPQLQTRFQQIDATHFTCNIYRSGQRKTSCRIWYGRNNFSSNGIFYSSNDAGRDNSFNESMSIKDDGYTLQLQPLGMGNLGSNPKKFLTIQGGGEYFWEMFLQPMQ